MPAATSWSALLDSDGAEKFTVTATRNGTITGGTAQALPTGETAAFTSLHAVLRRCVRTILAKRASGTIPVNQDISFQIAVSSDSTGPMFTGTVQYGATSVTGGTTITAPIGGTTAVDLIFALNRATNRILNDYRANG